MVYALIKKKYLKLSYFDRTNEKTILTGMVGSQSYGTATQDSDHDFMSFVVAPPLLYFGLESWGSSGTKREEYEDASIGHVEHQYFEIKKAISLCSAFNSNIIPLLWLNPKHYTNISPEGQLLLDNRNLFSSKKAYHAFSGYAHSQLQKMGGVFNDAEEENKKLKAGYQRFIQEATEEINNQRSLKETIDIATFDKYDAGYLNAMISLRTHAQEEVKRIQDGPITGRMGAKRKELREKYGYDTKFLSHTIRLMRMCNEFLRHPEEGLKVCRTKIDAEFLYSIRTGAFTQEEGKKMADELFAEARGLVKISSLPDEPDYEKINTLTMCIIKMSLNDSSNCN